MNILPMAMLVDPYIEYDSEVDRPPGFSGPGWAHLVSDTSLVEITAFVTLNVLTLGLAVANIRTPLLGSNVTYIPITDAQRTAAIADGASAVGGHLCFASDFDAPSSGHGTYEP